MWLRLQHVAAIVCAVGMFGGPEALAWQLGARPAERWIELLSRPERVEQLRIDDVIERLRIGPGDAVADIGAGAGVFSLPFARAVSPGGKVYAVEVDQSLVDHIAEAAGAEGVANVEPVLGEFTDPKLPAQNLDLAFFHDVLHHVEDRAGYLVNLAPHIAPEGRIAIVERTGGHGGRNHGPGDREALHMTQEQVTDWMAAVGFRPAEQYYLFGDAKWFVVYARE